jgi:hypothetical protein
VSPTAEPADAGTACLAAKHDEACMDFDRQAGGGRCASNPSKGFRRIEPKSGISIASIVDETKYVVEAGSAPSEST